MSRCLNNKNSRSTFQIAMHVISRYLW